jgi:hypothetical protein
MIALVTVVLVFVGGSLAELSQSEERQGPEGDSKVSVECRIEVLGRSAGGVRIGWSVANTGSEPVHLLRSPRMPYLLVTDPGHAVLSWAVQALTPGTNYGMIPIPSTTPLLAGARESGEVLVAVPLQESSHLRSPTPYSGELDEPVSLDAEFGFLDHALPKNPNGQNYPKIVESMQRCTAEPVTVSLRPR